MPDTRTASCNCGAIRIEARGQPVRVGLCHCMTCRKESGAPYTAYADGNVIEMATRSSIVTCRWPRSIKPARSSSRAEFVMDGL